MPTIAQPEPTRVTIGVDTHGDLHVAAARDQLGRPLGTTLVPATLAGYQHLLGWTLKLGEPVAFGIEGTGCYGAGLARYLRANGQQVIEVNRPDRATRRRKGKSDPVDADAAARAVQAGDATATPKAGVGVVEMLRMLHLARKTAIKARTQTMNALRALLVTAPPELREQLRGLSKTMLPRAAAALQAGRVTSPAAAAMLALASLGRRHATLTDEIATLDAATGRLLGRFAQPLLDRVGIGPDSASALLLAAGDNPGRLRSEAAFAALYRIVIVRLRWHQPTREYMARRIAEGKTKTEVIRCLKRYVAREVFAVLNTLAFDLASAA